MACDTDFESKEEQETAPDVPLKVLKKYQDDATWDAGGYQLPQGGCGHVRVPWS